MPLNGFDNWARNANRWGFSVSRLSKVFSLLLLGIWFSATQHCGLEASGILDVSGSGEACCPTGDACSRDACHVVETGVAKSALEISKAPTPVLFVCAYLFAPSVLLPESSEITGQNQTFDRPLDWLVSWQFSRRAAPLSRAPSRIG